MSRKFVPSFLKDTVTSTVSEPQTRTFTNNRFATLSDEKPLVNTSRPAKEAPKLVPATLASITSNGQGGKGTYAAKMAEMAKITANPNYVPPPKPIDVSSESEFPSLGGPKKNAVVIEPVKKSNSYASLARDWAKQKEEEEEEERLIKLRLEEEEKEKALFKSMTILSKRRKMRNEYSQEDDDDDNQYEESSLAGDSDDSDLHDESETSEDEQYEEDEFNQNVGWDGRRRDDLY